MLTRSDISSTTATGCKDIRIWSFKGIQRSKGLWYYSLSSFLNVISDNMPLITAYFENYFRVTDFLNLNPHMTRNGSLDILEGLLKEKLVKLVVKPTVLLKRVTFLYLLHFFSTLFNKKIYMRTDGKKIVLSQHSSGSLSALRLRCSIFFSATSLVFLRLQ